ncbi:two component response regulator [Acidisarcina polymorpha]|uniref:Two component response regulator n=2 Tax=Acidisarcina polymorpha TaxID=2211140 RepID=A0A2Z5G4Q2_9BACT|nr:two component response regulator [Acidisarcina polymorpha]
MFESYAEVEVLNALASGEEALEFLRLNTTDVVLLDLRMPGLSGLDVLRSLKSQQSKVRVLILTSFELDEDIYQAVSAGADGYLLKNTPDEEIIKAVRIVLTGKRHIPDRVAAKLAERMMRTQLTARELEVLELMVKGLTNRQLARVLEVSVHTIRNHVDSILRKLDVSDRTEASTTAIQQGLIRLPD